MTTKLQKIEAEAKSFLKNAEHDAAVAIEAVAGVASKAAPEAEAAAFALGYPEVALAIQKIIGIIVGAGAIVNAASNGTGTGADKLAVAAPQIEKLITGSGVFGSAVVADVNKYNSAVAIITSGFANLVDAHTAAAAVPAPPAAPPAPKAPAPEPENAQDTLAKSIGGGA
jgi:hypothetical protein